MFLGIDIGGTDIKFGVVAEDGQVFGKRQIPTLKTADDIIDSIVATCLAMREEYAYSEIGIACPGDVQNGVVAAPGNLPFRNTPLAAIISERVGVPVKMGNDARCAGFAEARCGAGEGTSNMVLITLGTGIGGALIINGEVYLGYTGSAGEVGHILLDHEGLPCPCGRKGCFEQYASVTALIRQSAAAAAAYPDSVLAACCSERPVDGKTVFDAMDKGCPVAADVYAQYIAYLAAGIDSLTILLQPELVVLGGAISREGERLLAPLRKALRFPMRVETAQLGGDAGIIGAAMLCK